MTIMRTTWWSSRKPLRAACWMASQSLADMLTETATLPYRAANLIVKTVTLSGAADVTGAVGSITPAVITGVTRMVTLVIQETDMEGGTLSDGAFTYDGTAHVLEVEDLPVDATVSYAIDGEPGNSAVNAGVHEIAAVVSRPTHADKTLMATLTIDPAERMLTFPPIGPKTYGDDNFLPEAAANSGEAVSYTSNRAVAEITIDGLVRVTGAGEAVITATVPENGNLHSMFQRKFTAIWRVSRLRQLLQAACR